MVRGYFEDISVEIEHAAQVDCYSWWQIFLKILLPLIKPGLVASALLCFFLRVKLLHVPRCCWRHPGGADTVAATNSWRSPPCITGRWRSRHVLGAAGDPLAIIIQKALVPPELRRREGIGETWQR